MSEAHESDELPVRYTRDCSVVRVVFCSHVRRFGLLWSPDDRQRALVCWSVDTEPSECLAAMVVSQSLRYPLSSADRGELLLATMCICE